MSEIISRLTGRAVQLRRADCDHCGGSGWEQFHLCSVCGGDGCVLKLIATKQGLDHLLEDIKNEL